MKIVKLKKYLTVVLKDGTILTNTNCTEEMYQKVLENADTNEDAVLELLIPEFYSKVEEYETKKNLLDGLASSQIIKMEGNSAYIPSISNLSLPEELAVAIFSAEKKGDNEILQTYLNFWTLSSLNPNAEARKNMFWFLRKYGMRISKSGLFIVYRNVEVKSDITDEQLELAKFISAEYVRVKFKMRKAPSKYYVGYNKEGDLSVNISTDRLENTIGKLDDLYFKYSEVEENSSELVFTDSYSKKYKIKIGTPVTMPREKCDEDQSATCSRGLHVAGRDWLEQGYFGKTSIMCLVNPADVVAVPPYDNYGKMRVCAYYPVKIVERDSKGTIINDDFESGFEDDFMKIISYSGEVNNVDESGYTISMPSTPYFDRGMALKNVKAIADKMNKLC